MWPDDSSKRHAFCTAINLKSVEEFRTAITKGKQSPHREIADMSANAFHHLLLDPKELEKYNAFGEGMSSLWEDATTRWKSMVHAGRTLRVLAAMRQHHSQDPRLSGGPGIKKAQEVVARNAIEKTRGGIAVSRIEQAWSRFRIVSHFIAAALDISDEEETAPFFTLWNPDKELIGVSHFYRRLLTEFVPRHRTHPLVSKTEILLPPDEWNCPEIPVNHPELQHDTLEFLSSRTAR